MSASPSLVDLQRWMRWALTHPLGVGRAIAGHSLPGLPDRFVAPSSSALAALAADPTPGRTALDRLSVHGAGYFSRLHGALRLEYPRLAAALGEEDFGALVAAHLLPRPSTSPSLADLGEGLDATLRAHPAGAAAPWLVDLAAVERASAEVWLSDAGTAGAWMSDEKDWSELRLTLAATARLVRVGWDVVDWAQDGTPPVARAGLLVVWRVEASTGMEWLAPGPDQLLQELTRGVPLGEACALAEALRMSAEDVTAAFAHWTGRGWLELAPGDPRNPEQLRDPA
jgi:hypothetical protein